MSNVYHTKLGEGRRVAIPAEACEQLGLRPGAPLTILIKDDGLHVVPYEQIVREVQAAFAPYRQSGVSVVDGLIRERREEAACEERELEESDHEPRKTA
jgi:AbrB family looped-hinge helix DNA binding protein